MEGFALLPAAVTMVAGPQIISAVILATSRDAKRNSAAYLAGVLAAAFLGTLLWLGVMSFVGDGDGGGSQGRTWVDWVVAALLAAVAIRTFVTRESAEPPKWMTGLQNATPKASLKLGFLLFVLMPTDIAMEVSVARYLVKNDLALWHALPFFVLTMTLISLPFLAYLLLGKRAEDALPRVRDWMNEYSWAINIAICAYFIYSVLA